MRSTTGRLGGQRVSGCGKGCGQPGRQAAAAAQRALPLTAAGAPQTGTLASTTRDPQPAASHLQCRRRLLWRRTRRGAWTGCAPRCAPLTRRRGCCAQSLQGRDKQPGDGAEQGATIERRAECCMTGPAVHPACCPAATLLCRQAVAKQHPAQRHPSNNNTHRGCGPRCRWLPRRCRRACARSGSSPASCWPPGAAQCWPRRASGAQSPGDRQSGGCKGRGPPACGSSQGCLGIQR